MFSISSSSWCWLRFWVPLKAKCSRKWAVPLVLSVSAREPASIHTPTVEVCAYGECSVAICRIPLMSVSISRFNTVNKTDSEAIAQSGGLGCAGMADGSGQSAAGDVAVERTARLDSADSALGAEPLLEVQREASGCHGGCEGGCGRSVDDVLQCWTLRSSRVCRV